MSVSQTVTCRRDQLFDSLSDDLLRAPKVLLHDHLDGGVRPATVVELAAETGYEGLPDDRRRASCRAGSYEAANSGSLERYLETFAHTVGVMQTAGRAGAGSPPSAPRTWPRTGSSTPRCATRPSCTSSGDLELAEVVEAVNEGFREGERRAAAAGHRIRVGALLTAMRHAARSMEIAELACATATRASSASTSRAPRPGYPPTRHLDAFEYLQRENAHFTIHAGEGFGLPSIWQAIQWCGADRLGHGVRIIDDITGRRRRTATLGRLAAYVRDKRIPLEMAPTSNVMTGAAKSIAEHPIGLLRRLYFRVTVNTDNRLMSGTTMTAEFEKLAEAFGYTCDDFQWFTVNAMKSAFIPFDERLALINDVIKPGYAALTG